MSSTTSSYRVLIPENLTFSETVLVWFYSIDWSESWLVSLLCFHLFVFLLALGTRNYTDFQGFLFFALLLLMYMTQYLNSWATENWTIFASKDYFDSNGSFIFFLYALPLLLNSLVVLVNLIRHMARLLILVKRAELREKKKKQAKKEE